MSGGGVEGFGVSAAVGGGAGFAAGADWTGFSGVDS
jgi:hypothetical protein